MWPVFLSIVANGKIEENGGVIARTGIHSLLYTRAHEEHCGAQEVITTMAESEVRKTSIVVLSVNATFS